MVVYFHTIDKAQHAELMRGLGSSAALSTLVSAHESATRGALYAVMIKAYRSPCCDSIGADIDALISSLDDVTAQSPDVVRDVLSHPTTRSWMNRCLREVTSSDSAQLPRGERCNGVAHWSENLRLSASLLAGREVTGTRNLWTDGSFVHLPKIGSLGFGDSDVAQIVTFEVEGSLSGPNSIRIRPPHRPRPCVTTDWLPARTADCRHRDLEIRLMVDDMDPFRRIEGLLPAPRLSDSEFERWRRLLAGAWRLLVERHPDDARALASLIDTVVPLQVDRSRAGMSASVGDCPGAIYATLPGDEIQMALVLVHELQHNKYAMLSALTGLGADDATPDMYAPWRGDPRPAAALLDGAYAHLGIVRFWLEEWLGTRSELAEFEFARWSVQVDRALFSLLDSKRLTSTGDVLARSLVEQIGVYRLHETSPEIERLAADASADHEAGWKIRNVEPCSHCAGLLCAELIRADLARLGVINVDPVAIESHCVDSLCERRLRRADRHLEITARYELMRARLEPDPTVEADSFAESDRAFVDGNYEIAQKLYIAQIINEWPDRKQCESAIGGLAVCRLRLIGEHDPLWLRPEQILAAIDLLRREQPTDARDAISRLLGE